MRGLVLCVFLVALAMVTGFGEYRGAKAAASAPTTNPQTAGVDNVLSRGQKRSARTDVAMDGELPPLLIPVAGVTAAMLRDTFEDGRPGHRHEAIDISAPQGTQVLAAVDGTLVKLFTSSPGGLTIYQFDLQRHHAYYYAHLDRYATGLHEGMVLHRGDVIGYVGTTGNASEHAPHLHFAVFRLGKEQQWWKGQALNPFDALRSGS